MPRPKDSNDSDDSKTQDVSAGTGEASIEENLQRSEADVLNARITFLLTAASTSTVCACLGLIAWKLTNSLTVEVDDISSWADVFSLFVNVAIERVKKHLHTRKDVLLADFMGGFISLSLLLGVAIFGVVNALKRSERSEEHGSESNVERPVLMLIYNAVCLSLDALVIFTYFKLKSRMEPKELSPDDKLNVVSGLVHMVVDLARSLSVTGTTFYMLYVIGKPNETPWEKLSEKIHGDVFGSFLVCTSVLLCVLVLMGVSTRTLWSLMDEHTEEQADRERGSGTRDPIRLSKLGRGSRDYGTLSDL